MNRLNQLKERAAIPYHEIPKVLVYEQTICEKLLDEGYPVLIENADIHGIWTPEHLKKKYGGELISIVEIGDNSKKYEVQQTLEDFLTLLETDNYSGKEKVSEHVVWRRARH